MRVSRRHFLVLSQGLTVAGCAGVSGVFVGPGPRFWEQHNSSSDRFVDHTIWGYLLQKHVWSNANGVNLVTYGRFSDGDREGLKAYIEMLANFPIETLNRREQYAYWLNLYNALVVWLVVDRYLVLSIKDINIGDGPFETTLIHIKDVPLSLSYIRKNILSSLFVDPRFHYGLCDAAIGSPKLLRKPFTGDRIDRMLDGAALDFVNHRRGVKIQENTIILSSIYRRFPKEFGRKPADLIEHIKNFAMDDLKRQLKPTFPITFAFDWSLNDGV